MPRGLPGLRIVFHHARSDATHPRSAGVPVRSRAHAVRAHGYHLQSQSGLRRVLLAPPDKRDRVSLIDGILAAVGAVLCFGFAAALYFNGGPR